MEHRGFPPFLDARVTTHAMHKLLRKSPVSLHLSLSSPSQPLLPAALPFRRSNTCRNSRGRWLGLLYGAYLLHAFHYTLTTASQLYMSAWGCPGRSGVQLLPGTCILQHRARRTDARRDLSRRSRRRNDVPPRFISENKKTRVIVARDEVYARRSFFFFYFFFISLVL